MATPRRELVDPENPLFYHVVSRCVRRAWLCGFDPVARKDYSHRKNWLIERLKTLGRAFAVDIYAYAIMSNHFHLVLYYDPKAPMEWSDFETVDRWLSVCPPKMRDGTIDAGLLELRRAALLSDSDAVDGLREKLGSLSLFMKLLKQPLARRANLEDALKGHFFEQRFYSSPLLCEESVKSAMAYVDLNPIRARIASTIADSEHTSIFERIQDRDPVGDLHDYLKPIISGLVGNRRVECSLSDYIDHLEALYPKPRVSHHWTEQKLKRWRAQIALLGRYQRAYGPQIKLAQWAQDRGWQLREHALPS